MSCFTCEKETKSLITVHLCKNGFGLCPFFHEEVSVGGNWPEKVCNPCAGTDAMETNICTECFESLKQAT